MSDGGHPTGRERGRIAVVYEARCGRCGATDSTEAPRQRDATIRFVQVRGWLKTRRFGLVCPACSGKGESP
jgi:hypothetical protein